jgi:multicomponent K+:H+ antiporter subunit D
VNHLVILPLLVPLLAGTGLVLLRGSATATRRAVSLLATAVLVAVALALLREVGGGAIEVYRLGNWPAPFGIVLVADRLAAAMVVVTALLAACTVVYAAQGSDRAGRHFHVLFQFQLFGLNGAFLTGDLFNLFVFFEVLLIASYGLLLHGGGRARTRAGLHYVVLNLAGSTLFLFAVGALYGVLGTLNMADLAQRMAVLPPEHAGVARAAGLLLFVVFALKAALVPLHLWLAPAYASTSAPVAALFAIMTKVGAYAILRVYTLVFGAEAGPATNLIEPWLLPLALATVVLGAVGAMASTRLSQQVAYLVLASAGTLLTAFGLGSTAAVAAGLYYLAHTTFAAAALFLLADVIGRARGDLSDRLAPGPALPRVNLLGGVFLLLAVAVAGIPPLSGFFGKFLILRASVDHPAMPWVLGVVLVTGLLTIVSLARAGSRLFYKVDESVAAPATGPRGAALAPAVALLALGVLMVVFAGPLYDYSLATAEQLVAPLDYQRAVLPPLGEVPRP